MAVIEVEGLTKRFGKMVLAVDDVSFAIQAGSITGFLGPNGAGKTTTLRMILDLVRPTLGSARVLGSRYRDLPRAGHRVLARCWTRPGSTRALRPQCPARHRRGRGAARRPGRHDARDGGAGWCRTAAVKSYSTGMRQRLALAAALLGDPEVLLLDEPANGLDPEGIRWLREFLRERAAEGRTVLISSHVLAEVEQTVDDVLIISKGRLLAQGPIRQLAAGAAPVVRVHSPQAERLETLLKERGVAVNRLETALAIRGPSSAEIGEIAQANGLVLHELFTQQASLEDLFLQIAGTRRQA
jgi:ABC-2 type transport system ATP-binding protein